MGQQTAASIKAAAASPSGASQTYKPPSPSQPMMPQSNVQVVKQLAKQKSDMIIFDPSRMKKLHSISKNDFYFTFL